MVETQYAFSCCNEESFHQPGLTDLEYYAAKAMPELIKTANQKGWLYNSVQAAQSTISVKAFDIAEAMVLEAKKRMEVKPNIEKLIDADIVNVNSKALQGDFYNVENITIEQIDYPSMTHKHSTEWANLYKISHEDFLKGAHRNGFKEMPF